MTVYIKEQKIIDNNKRALLKYVIISDNTTNLANNTLVDVSSLRFALNTSGKIMTANVNPKTTYKTTIKRIYGHGKFGGNIRLQWHGDQNTEIVTLASGTPNYDFYSMGDGATIPNNEANSSGDILITTIGAAASDAYTIFVDLRKDSTDYDAGQTADPVAFNQGPAAGA